MYLAYKKLKNTSEKGQQYGQKVKRKARMLFFKV